MATMGQGVTQKIGGTGSFRALMADAVTDTGDKGQIEVQNMLYHTFFVSISATATITIYWSPDDGVTWFAGNTITEAGVQGWAEVVATHLKINVTANTGTVTVWWTGRVTR